MHPLYYITNITCFLNTLGAETFASRIFAFCEYKLSRIGQNRIFRVLNFRECTEKFFFVVILGKSLDRDRNKTEKKTLLFQAFFVWPRFRAPNIFLTLK